MAMEILSSNSGTTFLRLGGTNKIKIKSNLAWTFRLLPLNDENDIEAVKILTETTEDEEIISRLVGTGSTYDNIKWINIINDLGNGVKKISGQGTTYLDIRADENFEGKDLFAVGYAEAITEPNLCDFTVFEQYGKSYYFAEFNNESAETEAQYIVRTPSEIEPSDTYVPVEIYTNTRCKVTISGIDSSSDTGEEFIVGTGVTKTGYPDESLEFKFRVPKNKTAESIVYTLRATSLEDPAFSQTYQVTHKGIEPRIILYPGEQFIASDQSTFTINYHIQPLTLAVDLGIFKQDTLVDVKNVTNSSLSTPDDVEYYEGAITYNCGKNEGGVDYQISGQTIGETFQVISETSPNIGTTALVHFQNYFEMIYGSQVSPPRTWIDVSGVDGDSGGKYDVSVHTNYPYSAFSVSTTGNLINDCTIIPVGDNYFTIEFNVKINKESSREGSITITNGIVSGIIKVSQGGGTEPTFQWVSGYDSVSGAEAWKTIGGVAGTMYPFGYSYTQQLYPRLNGDYNGVSVSNTNYGFTLIVSESYVGERNFDVYLSKTQTGLIEAVAELKVTQSNNTSYTNVIKYEYRFSKSPSITYHNPILKEIYLYLDGVLVGNYDVQGGTLVYFDNHLNDEIVFDGSGDSEWFDFDVYLDYAEYYNSTHNLYLKHKWFDNGQEYWGDIPSYEIVFNKDLSQADINNQIHYVVSQSEIVLRQAKEA